MKDEMSSYILIPMSPTLSVLIAEILSRLVPFNINPHYLDPSPDSTHKGETREQRIVQYHEEDDCRPVLALREGSILHVEGHSDAKLLGTFHARLFVKGKDTEEHKPGTNFGFLL